MKIINKIAVRQPRDVNKPELGLYIHHLVLQFADRSTVTVKRSEGEDRFLRINRETQRGRTPNADTMNLILKRH